MQLGFNISFEMLYEREGLSALDKGFVDFLAHRDDALAHRMLIARADAAALESKAHSQLLIDLAPEVEAFIGQLFGIEQEITALNAAHGEQAALFACKRLFIQRRAAKAVKEEEAKALKGDTLEAAMFKHLGGAFDELMFASAVMRWLDAPQQHARELEDAQSYAAWALYSDAGKKKHARGVLFKQPHKIDPQHLVHTETEIRDGITVLKLPQQKLRAREGFALTDDGGTLSQALDQAHYCIYCHNQGRDSCSTGLKEKDGQFKSSALGVALHGCPLEEKISEMNFLKASGVAVGALAVVTVDNPMCAGTGHRICNDCMKSCIYQKQEPVNIPQVETRTLSDVLALPYGFEIYSLLTRWNPLNLARTLPKAASGKRVLVAGLGPAGYTLAHHLLNDGHTVVAVDGLKIEPLPAAISGVNSDGTRAAFQPIKDFSALVQPLETRAGGGFGGVAEYGITVRWDKNYLTVLRLLLERRAAFSMIGGVRFGSTMTYDDAFALGFDHIALCMGAGKPTVLNIENGLARGVRAASDFLMSLQLTGAARADSIANLQLRLPAVVVGGGLTAIDTATEALAYYPVQVEKFLARYETLVHERGEQAVRQSWSEEEGLIADEFITHARAIRVERDQAAREGRAADVLPLLTRWGGVTIAYRKSLVDAPSYRLNHEEVEKAMEEGIFFAEGLEPHAVHLDRFNHAQSITLKHADGTQHTLPARAVLVAAGTSPNTVLAREDTAHFALDGRYFNAVDEQGNHVSPDRQPKPETAQVLMSVERDGRAVSFFGDLHPSFAGNVVKAQASAKRGYPMVTRVLEQRAPSAEAQDAFLVRINCQLRATVHAVNRLTPNIVEVVVKAPLAAKNFRPGQFYRLQNYEAFALRDTKAHTTLAMEGLALTGASANAESGLLSTIVLEMGGSSDLCSYLAPAEPVVLMGPTGEPTEITEGETVLLAGGGLGNAVLFSIGKAFRARGSKVLYFAGYKREIDRYKIEEIEAAADMVVWCCDEGAFTPSRPQDMSYHGNIVQAMQAYGNWALGIGDWGQLKSPTPNLQSPIPLNAVKRIIAIGSDRMMAAVQAARHGILKAHLTPGHAAIGSINSPMQCMMKEICAQCLQQHVDPASGVVSYVYSCYNQDQPLDHVSFHHLNERLKQNSVQEKLTALWIDRTLKSLGLRQHAA